jgi:hypothetical protein
MVCEPLLLFAAQLVEKLMRRPELPCFQNLACEPCWLHLRLSHSTSPEATVLAAAWFVLWGMVSRPRSGTAGTAAGALRFSHRLKCRLLLMGDASPLKLQVTVDGWVAGRATTLQQPPGRRQPTGVPRPLPKHTSPGAAGRLHCSSQRRLGHRHGSLCPTASTPAGSWCHSRSDASRGTPATRSVRGARERHSPEGIRPRIVLRSAAERHRPGQAARRLQGSAEDAHT